MKGSLKCCVYHAGQVYVFGILYFGLSPSSVSESCGMCLCFVEPFYVVLIICD